MLLFIQARKLKSYTEKCGDRMILIVGCGFLGTYLAQCICARTSEPVIATVRNTKNTVPLKNVEYIECDITKKDDIQNLYKALERERLTVFWFAACHNIDFICENKDVAYGVNVTALKHFLSYFTNIDKFYFASTDCVYGENTPDGKGFDESASLNPVNEYGRQKILAENLVRSEDFTVLRYPFMLGKSHGEKKHFYDILCSNLKEGIKTEMIDGMYRNVLSYRQAAELTFELSQKDMLPEVINICSDTVLSKYQLGLILAQKLGTSNELITKITEAQGQKFFKDKRACCTKMDNSLLKELTGHKKIIWEEEECFL